MAAFQLGRAAIETKRRAYGNKPELEKVGALVLLDWIRSVRDTQFPESQMREPDVRWVGNLMFRQGPEDHGPVSRLGVKIE